MQNKSTRKTAQKSLYKSRTIWANASALASTLGLIILELSHEIKNIDAALQTTGTEVDIFRYILAGLAIAGSVVSIYARIDDRIRKGR